MDKNINNMDTQEKFIKDLMFTANGGTFLFLFYSILIELSIEIDFSNLTYQELSLKISECKDLILKNFKSKND